MAEQTRLGLTATPGRPYAAFAAKTEAVGITWTNVIFRGIDAITGDYIYLQGQYREP